MLDNAKIHCPQNLNFIVINIYTLQMITEKKEYLKNFSFAIKN